MDETIQDEQVVIDPVVDDTTETNETELDNEQLLAQKKHWRDKAIKEAEARKKAEAELEALKNKPVENKTNEVQPTQDYITKKEYEEGILRTSKGYGDEDITVLNVISKGKGISLIQAEQDPMFKLHQENKAEEAKKAKAQLGASRGSGQSQAKKEPKTREDHEAMWKEKLGL